MILKIAVVEGKLKIKMILNNEFGGKFEVLNDIEDCVEILQRIYCCVSSVVYY